MIVTLTSLSGYSLLNGTWGIQMALLVASIFNVMVFPNQPLLDDLNIELDTPLTKIQTELIFKTRSHLIPVVHGLMMVTTAISGSDRLNLDSLKQISSFLGIILNMILIVQISHCMCLFPYPMHWEDPVLSATYVWFEVEWGIFIGNIASNSLFLLLRSFTHHKLQLDQVPVKK
jgi:hypothetical protein